MWCWERGVLVKCLSFNPQKWGVSVNTRKKMRVIHKIALFFYAKSVNWGIWGGRIIKDNNDIAPFKNILNDMYAKDISRKIKSAKRQRMYKGMYVAAQPPYGYKVIAGLYKRYLRKGSSL